MRNSIIFNLLYCNSMGSRNRIQGVGTIAGVRAPFNDDAKAYGLPSESNRNKMIRTGHQSFQRFLPGVLIFIAIFVMLPGRKLVAATPGQPSDMERFDVVVVGATPAGIAAAVTVAREGRSVALVEQSHRIGGMTANGLSNTDFLTHESLGGLWREFMDRVVAYYNSEYGYSSKQVSDAALGGYYEPKAALAIFHEMIGEQGARISLFLNYSLTGSEIDRLGVRPRIIAADFEKVTLREGYIGRLDSSDPDYSRLRLHARVFIDATYEGDLLAAAGVPYAIGVEPRSAYNESLAPETGSAHVQCANFRVTLTRSPSNRLTIQKPDDYDRRRYLPILESVAVGKIKELFDLMHGPNRPIPNQKADFNDKQGSPVSLRICNSIDDWPEASLDRRFEIYAEAKSHAKGLFYFIQNDAGFAKAAPGIVQEFAPWGLPKDEFEVSGHWPPQLYIREARRMIGMYVFTERDAQHAPNSVRAPHHPRAVAIGDYPISVHGLFTPEEGRTIGVVYHTTRPFQVPYDVMLPRHLDGLMVPVAVSSSHIGFQPIRLEPVWTALGQAAGLAASQAIAADVMLREIKVDHLQTRLHALGAMTFYATDVLPGSPYFAAVQYLGNRGFFQDLVDPKVVGKWRSHSPTEKLDIAPPHQWRKALPYHAIDTRKAIAKSRATSWLERAGIDREEFGSIEGMTRGTFLQRLYVLLWPPDQISNASETIAPP